jgi:hypothetical protein
MDRTSQAERLTKNPQRKRRRGGKKPWRLMSDQERARQRARLKRRRRQRYATDPAYKAKIVAKIVRLVKRRGGKTKRGPTGWPVG